MDVIIVGGGVSGLMSAIHLKNKLKDKVKITILERLEKVGKKILATGNGKCNFTNTGIVNNNNIKENYSNPKFVSNILSKYDYPYIKKYLENLGLYSKELSEGRVYPYTEQASTFLDVLRLNINKLGIEIENNYEVNKIAFKDNKFLVYNKNKRAFYLTCDKLILACGGKSAQILGSNGSGYDILKALKLKVSPFKPGLVGIKSDVNTLKTINGLRCKAMVSLYQKKAKKIVKSEFGEVQFKNDGLSGIVVMNLSNYIAHNPSNYNILLDLLPDYSLDDVKKILKKKQEDYGEFEISNLLTGLLPKTLSMVILKKASIDLSIYIKDLNTRSLNKIANFIKELPFEVKGDYGFDKSQISVGGLEVSELDPDTLEVKKIPNLYVAGELINVDGKCGGFNFHWALASGIACSDGISLRKKDTNVRNKRS